MSIAGGMLTPAFVAMVTVESENANNYCRICSQQPDFSPFGVSYSKYLLWRESSHPFTNKIMYSIIISRGMSISRGSMMSQPRGVSVLGHGSRQTTRIRRGKTRGRGRGSTVTHLPGPHTDKSQPGSDTSRCPNPGVDGTPQKTPINSLD